ncbi:ABC transporter permease [Christensenella tenuis]|jgi:ribose transport system permease protein|uniref:ABC transporter permease n=1 Tax=Christensenella tenuis TaxID=2763033 RepID=A0ABR7ECI5_9FIRM|nr:ABC transporter permease [Christensenella tenuis]MBC5647490.1 ABC transporter permease [Christensenella tenuis]
MTNKAADAAAVKKDVRRTDISKRSIIVNKLGIYIVVAILLVVGLIIKQGDYVSIDNLRSILSAVALTGICCAGLAFVVYSANFNDMSLPMTIALSGMMAVQLIPFGIVVSVLGGLAAGTLVGVVNGVLIGKFRANPIIWTLAFNLVLSGIVRVAWGGSQIYPDVVAGDSPAALAAAEQFTSFARTYFLNGSLPLMVVVMIVLFVVAYILLTRTKFGNQLKIVGSNYEVAKLSGINTSKTIILAYVFCSFCAAVTGIFYASQTKIGAYSNGEGYDFSCLTAVLLGGMMLSGGKGTIVGVFGGVLVVGMLNNIMTLIGIPTFQQYLVTGLVFLFVVWLNTNSERKLGRA